MVSLHFASYDSCSKQRLLDCSISNYGVVLAIKRWNLVNFAQHLVSIQPQISRLALPWQGSK
jgi:hypothetical protein